MEKVAAWLQARARPYFYLAGYAGTGKTTIAKYLAADVKGKVLFAAFTGKAASVLRKMGCPNARTLHSILYSVNDDLLVEQIKNLKIQLANAVAEGLPKPDVERIRAEIKELKLVRKRGGGGPTFTLNPASELAEASLLVLDEVSMINRELAEDALSFNIPILVLGDPAQLPPVKGAGYFTSHRPDHLLTEIHRQAADNPIIQWATAVRQGKPLPFTKGAGDPRVQKLRRGQLDFDNLPRDVQVLTGKNKIRRELNMRIRRSWGFKGDLPVKGDKLVCLKNDAETGLLNGVLCEAGGDAERVNAEELAMDVLMEGMLLEDLPVSSIPFEKYVDPEAEDDIIDRYLQQFDYGYCLTVHKSQGSQWENVIVADDGFGAWNPELRRQWLYTAITRARECLTIVA